MATPYKPDPKRAIQMSSPFEFSGSLNLPAAAEPRATAEHISVALRSVGARNISVSDRNVRFEGLVSYRSLSPIISIVHGEMQITQTTPKLLHYSIAVERSGLLGSLGVAL